jgi:hypothetical protein
MSIKQIEVFVAGVTLYLDTENTKDAIAQSMFWQSLPTACPKCNSGVKFNHYITKEKKYKYYGLKCMSEKPHSINFHEYQDQTLGFFLKYGEEWTEYRPNNELLGDEAETPASLPQREVAPAPRTESAPPAPVTPVVTPAADPAEPARVIDVKIAELETAKVLADKVKVDTVNGEQVWRVGAMVVALKVAAGKKAVTCDCKKFVEKVLNDPGYRCEHIFAVKMFVDQQRAAAAAAK